MTLQDLKNLNIGLITHECLELFVNNTIRDLDLLKEKYDKLWIKYALNKSSLKLKKDDYWRLIINGVLKQCDKENNALLKKVLIIEKEIQNNINLIKKQMSINKFNNVLKKNKLQNQLKPYEERILRVIINACRSLTTSQISKYSLISYNCTKKNLQNLYDKKYIKQRKLSNRIYWNINKKE